MYNSYIDVSKKFKSSVNLQFDLNNEEKILQYVPTTDLCDVIKVYIKSLLKSDGLRSTFLAGPYGKGKSYLMLIITYLISKRSNRQLFKKVVEKFRKIDNELADLIVEVDDRKISLLPIVINNNNSDDFNQNFMLALKNALIENDLNDIIPNSTFQECLDLIQTWELEKEKNGFDIFDTCIKELNVDLDYLKEGLQSYSVKSYKEFEKLFNCVSRGYNFNPLVSNDISYLYSDVAIKVKKYGYKGIFVIFDEFGIFLDNQNDKFNINLNKIQTLSEKCNASDDETQMHICCITHKDVMLYSKNKEMNDPFKAISGRFKSVRFDRSLEENYEILCSALEKSEQYITLVNDYKIKYNYLFENIRNLSVFTNDQLEFLIENGIPFNPLSIYAMINVSEKVAQNERTMFTFLSDSDVNTFRYFIKNNEVGLLNVNYIYDYFEDLIKDHEQYNFIYSQTKSLMKLSLDEMDHNIFKSLAIIKVINDDIKLPSSIQVIANCLCISVDEVERRIEDAVKNNLLIIDSTTKFVNFSSIADANLSEKINKYIETKMINKTINELINYFNKEKYVVSNRYNFEFEMTRYFKCLYLESYVLENINDLSLIGKDVFADGLVINLINDLNLDDISIQKMLNQKSNNETVIIRKSNNEISDFVINKFKLYYAANQILDSQDLDAIQVKSLELLIDDLNIELVRYLKNYLIESISITSSNLYHMFVDATYDILKENYSQTVILNNEQINKNSISKVSAKSRNNVIDTILKKAEFTYGPTSAEGTIYSSFKISLKHNMNIINLIKSVFLNSNGNPIYIKELVNMLRAKPYGMRIGIIPLYIAQVVSELTLSDEDALQTIVFYNKNTEVDLNSSTLSEAVEFENEFYLVLRIIDNEKYEMVNEIAKLYNIESENNFVIKLKNIVLAIKNLVFNLPPVIIRTNRKENILNLTSEEIQFKDLFMKSDLNSFDIVFEQLPLFFKCQVFELKEKLINIMRSYQRRIDLFYKKVISDVKNIYCSCDGSIKTSFNLWVSNYEYIDQIIFNDDMKKIYHVFKEIQFDDIQSIDKLSYAIGNNTIVDWNSKKYSLFIQKITDFKEIVEKYVESSVTKDNVKTNFIVKELSLMAKTLKNNLEDELFEYGESVSNEEKVAILQQLLDKILN